MKKFKSSELIDQLEWDVQQIIATAEHLKQADNVKLSYAPAEGKWSVAQCIEHLNYYSRYYNDALEKAIAPLTGDQNAWFTPGVLGNFFTKMMKPTNVYEIKNKMKTQKAAKPDKSVNVESTFNEFFEHQHKLLRLLEISRKRDLGAISVPTSLSKLLKLKLGDTLRFLIAHEQRHMIQARNTIREVGVPTDKFPVILQVNQL